MSTTATSLIPSPSSLRSSYNPALQSAQNTVSQVTNAVTSAPSNVSRSAQNLSLALSKSSPNPAEPATPPSTPGKFRHPMTTEILRRNAATALTDRSVKGAATNAAALLLTFIFSDVYYSSVPPLLKTSGIADPSQISWAALLIIRLLFCLNMILLLRPIVPYISQKDQITDIPLTPSQRSLLGLSPSVHASQSPAGSAASYITPPRYRRLSGSFSGSPTMGSQLGYGSASTDRRSISANYSSSPLSTSRHTLGFSPTPSQSLRRTVSGSPFSPSPTASPLFHKAVSQNQSSQNPDAEFGTSTRSGFGAISSGNTGLSRSQSMRERRPRRESLEPNSPSPTRATQVVPGLNYKWLYDKGRKLPKSDSFGTF
ncbi:uncharacterized protein Z520_10105 [Fonsecaea multimorphosa CBS 102226]|uniref:Nucleoporin POM34 n=1 Tax=Fonsecaea multimorphosa CBS 102226 TaxID=1442371 RepID=A0A0D2JUA1_9EURO|nr:uncharacterized protein Z520_10105 [Fonsecaea multimorphosa CBS 102226]KIX94079.1 hypothetical protein Z520_10105 [Fonsecaea multimorphosa CBS 102226]OAL19432.1 hypothetical protein AYO22_09594 [Fonsecaea multimorphosa]